MPNTKHDEGVVSRHLLTNTHEDPAPSNPAIGPNNPCQHCGGSEPISEIDGRCNYCFGSLILADETKTPTARRRFRENHAALARKCPVPGCGYQLNPDGSCTGCLIEAL